MLTGSSDDRALLAAIDAGCSGFLTKDRAASRGGQRGAGGGGRGGADLAGPARPPAPSPRSRPGWLGHDLTDRERQLLGLLAEGSSNKVIAGELHLSVNTIRNYVQSVLTKLGAHSKLEAVSLAVREGIISYPSGC